MRRGLEGQVAIVTGGGTGIGAAITTQLADIGAHVVVVQRTESEALSAAERLGKDRRAVSGSGADLSTADGCRAAIATTVERHGRIDILVNNAAVTGPSALAEFVTSTDEQLDAIIDINLKAAFRCARHAARHMIDQHSGVIVNISSVGARRAQRNAVAYCASKAGMDAVTRGLAAELGRYGIRAVGVAPGDIALDTLTDDRGLVLETPLGRRGHPTDIAAVVAFLCSSPASFITGDTLLVDGGFTAGKGGL